MFRSPKKLVLLLLGLLLFAACVPQFFYSNSGQSTSHGSTGNGRLENAYLMDYRLDNAKYFSLSSYYLLGNGYVNSRVYHTLLEAYQSLSISCPDRQFYYMECSSKKGGKQLIHRTHQNGLSVDFMVPKIRHQEPSTFYDHLGVWHYLLQFDEKGRLNFQTSVQIDFETMGKHLIALDDAARNHGLRIKKVILKINLKDDFFKTESGKEIKRRGIYFAQALSPVVDKLHDDHYHVDFALR